MSDKKLTQLTELTTVADDDFMYITDTSTGQSAKAQAKNIRGIPRTTAEISAGVTPTNYQYEPGNVLRYGAVGDGVTDDTTAIQNALDTMHKVLVPIGEYLITSPLNFVTGNNMQGEGIGELNGSRIKGTAGMDATLAIGDGSTATTEIIIRDLRLTGASIKAVYFNSAQNLKIDNIRLSGTYTDGFVFQSNWASYFSNLKTNGAAISGSCFHVAGAFNGNYCDTWYTSNFCDQNILIDAASLDSTGSSHGSTWSMLTIQGGDIGLYVKQYSQPTFNGLYFENVARPIVLGSESDAQTCIAVSMNGIDIGGPASSHPDFANRMALIDFNRCHGAKISGINFSGVFNVDTVVPITFTGGSGSGAAAEGRITPAGVVHSIEVITEGSGYASDPTVVIGGAGSGATATATRNGTVVDFVTVTDGGSGYVQGSGSPLAIIYDNCSKIIISGFYINTGSGTSGQLWPWVARHTGAASGSSIEIQGDISMFGTANSNSLNMVKTQPFNYKHYLIERDTTGAEVVHQYLPPSYP